MHVWAAAEVLCGRESGTTPTRVSDIDLRTGPRCHGMPAAASMCTASAAGPGTTSQGSRESKQRYPGRQASARFGLQVPPCSKDK